jgi:plastocyanin
MRVLSATGAAVALLGIAAFGAAEAQGGPAAPGPARLQVSADEFRYTLSRLRLPAGKAVVQLVNFGEDDHNLRLRRRGRTYVHRLPRTAPGELSELRAILRRGRYKLWCSLPGHEAAGMKATLRVFRPS